MMQNQVIGGNFDSEGGETSLPVLTTIPAVLDDMPFVLSTITTVGGTRSQQIRLTNSGGGTLTVRVTCAPYPVGIFTFNKTTFSLTAGQSDLLIFTLSPPEDAVTDITPFVNYSFNVTLTTNAEDPISFAVTGRYEPVPEGLPVLDLTVPCGSTYNLSATAGNSHLFQILVTNTTINSSVTIESAVITLSYPSYAFVKRTLTPETVLHYNETFEIPLKFQAPVELGFYTATLTIIRGDTDTPCIIYLRGESKALSSLNVSTTQTGARSAKVTWDAVPDATSYEVYVDGLLVP